MKQLTIMSKTLYLQLFWIKNFIFLKSYWSQVSTLSMTSPSTFLETSTKSINADWDNTLALHRAAALPKVASIVFNSQCSCRSLLSTSCGGSVDGGGNGGEKERHKHKLRQVVECSACALLLSSFSHSFIFLFSISLFCRRISIFFIRIELNVSDIYVKGLTTSFWMPS